MKNEKIKLKIDGKIYEINVLSKGNEGSFDYIFATTEDGKQRGFFTEMYLKENQKS